MKTQEKMYMNPVTGSVDVAAGWEPEYIDNQEVVEVVWNETDMAWEEVE